MAHNFAEWPIRIYFSLVLGLAWGHRFFNFCNFKYFFREIAKQPTFVVEILLIVVLIESLKQTLSIRKT